jgi:hypothetical protein
MLDDADLIGTWRLVALERRLSPSGEAIPDHPRQGYLTFSPGRRMMTILVWADRQAPAGEVPTDAERIHLHKSVIAFAGRYSIQPDRLVFHIDTSWNESWTGHDHTRFPTLDGNRLTLSTDPHRSAVDGRESTYRQVWEKLG